MGVSLCGDARGPFFSYGAYSLLPWRVDRDRCDDPLYDAGMGAFRGMGYFCHLARLCPCRSFSTSVFHEKTRARHSCGDYRRIRRGFGPTCGLRSSKRARLLGRGQNLPGLSCVHRPALDVHETRDPRCRGRPFVAMETPLHADAGGAYSLVHEHGYCALSLRKRGLYLGASTDCLAMVRACRAMPFGVRRFPFAISGGLRWQRKEKQITAFLRSFLSPELRAFLERND